MTYPDKTVYPFATRNIKEYFNIMDIYLDTTLYPSIDKLAFLQEGWRYHLKNINDKIKIKGIVYNEMKGVYSDPTTQTWNMLFKNLMPDSTYSHDSGGNPKDIPNLTWNDLKNFHKQFYHPSNGIFLFYGNADLQDELEFLHNKYLINFSKRKSTEKINLGRKNNSQKKLIDTYSISKDENEKNKTFLILGIPISNVNNDEEILALKILGEILFSANASPLKIDFFKSKIGKDIEGGLLSQNQTAIMYIEIIGSESNKMDDFLNLYNSSMKNIVQEGLNSELILSELNSFEFNKREQSCNGQRGLNYILRLIQSKKLDKDPFEALKSNKLFKTVRKKILSEDYLNELIKNKLINLNRSVVITLKPKKGKSEDEDLIQEVKLSKYKSSLSENELKELVDTTKEFKKYQNSKNSEKDLLNLPSLNINDIPQTINYLEPKIILGENNSTKIINENYTNGISYYNFGFDASVIPQHLLPLLDVFGMIITEVGSKKYDYIEFSKKKNIYTGGINHQFFTYNQRENKNNYKSVFWINIKILTEYINEGLNLFSDIIFNYNLNNMDRIKEIILRNFAWIENQVKSEGYHLSLSRSRSGFNESYFVKELVFGLESFLYLKKLVANYENMRVELHKSLNQIAKLLFNKNNLIINYIGSKEDYKLSNKIIEDIFGKLNSKKFPKQNIEVKSNFTNDALINSSKVVYAVQTGQIFNSSKDYNGSFDVLKSYLSNIYLHEKIRAQGGAYGCFPLFDSSTGLFSIVSYRDPNVKETYNVYDNIYTDLKNIDLSKHNLEQLIIRTYGQFDPLLNPYSKGIMVRNRYLTGTSKEFIEKTIFEIKSTDIKQLKNYTQNFKEFKKKSIRSIIGNRTKIFANKNLFEKIIHL